MDFFVISSRETKTGPELYPDFLVGRSKDLMIQGHSVYAVWDEVNGLWSQDEYDVQRFVDDALRAAAAEHPGKPTVKYMRSSNSGSWARFKAHLNNLGDDFHVLDGSLTFASDTVKKTDYVSKRLPYSLVDGPHPSWDEILGTLYSEEERAKIEWSIGAVVSGDSKNIQKFLVFYGPAGTGKSTVLNIIHKMFAPYTATFEAKALGSNNGQFATEAFKNNPLVAIQHDGDLSRIEDNTRLNSIIAHEDMTMNEKYKPSYTARVNAFLFMGTNQPVKITDAKSGIIRRLLDVHPTGKKIPSNHYNALMTQVDFELGAIAKHCLDVYRRMGKNYYNAYRPTEMMLRTDVFFNFIEANFDIFKSQEYVTLAQAYTLYKEFCSDSGVDRVLPRHQVREELANYFEVFEERRRIGDHWVRSCYTGFTADKFKVKIDDEPAFSLVLEEKESLLDRELSGCTAQLAKEDGTPRRAWNGVTSKLSDITTSELHYVKLPENHIVVDFDLRDASGEKSREVNLRAASEWPPTYAEFSKSGAGIHLHYIYPDDPSLLANVYSEGIEIKTFKGNASLRRQHTLSNNVPIALITGGLPFKEQKKVQTEQTIKGERGLRELILRNLRKEIHPGTKPSIDFIHKILEDAHEDGVEYDLTDLRPRILAFANNSTNKSLECLKVVQRMKFTGKLPMEDVAETDTAQDDKPYVFFDVEVYPNLFVICWKFRGSDEIVKMINPKPEMVAELFKLRLIGFNNRRYDNHILYAASMGYGNKDLYELSQKIIDSDRNNNSSLFGAAYDLSFTDIFDFSSKKQSLKKFQIELGLKHLELDIPWDQPVPDERIPDVVEYCCNDVISTEATFEARIEDFVARQIMAELSGLSVNASTQMLTTKIVFGNERSPQKYFEYTDLSKEFPGYHFEKGVSTYKGAKINEGGYVYAEPGMYQNVAVLDIASMHPTTIEVLNVFGPFTKNFSSLKAARIAIKRGDFASARKMLDGKLAPFLKDESQAKNLSYALKIAINIVYGLTSAKFPNAFRDSRNVDNIVAKRGSLFMVDLQEAFRESFPDNAIIHIKTDSVKIPEATEEMIAFVQNFGANYGYEFEHESTYDKFCLVNDAVYIAREKGKWYATGAQFAHPYVYKTLFSQEPLTFEDYFEAKSVVKGAMYLDFNYDQPAVLSHGEMLHIGRTGRFIPVLAGGGVLYRMQNVEGEDKYYAVTGTKGHYWMEETMAKQEGDVLIDFSYFENLKTKAYEAIDHWGSYMDFIGN